MKLITWVALAGLVIVLAVVALWDEALNPRAQAWLAPDNRVIAAGSNGYFTLMGLFAAPADRPHDVGRKRVQAYELAISTTQDISELVFEDYPDSKRLRLGAEFEFLCQIEKANCLTRFLDHADTIVALTEKHHTLLGRYHSLYEYPAFHSSATPGFNEPLVPYHLLATMNRLQLAQISVEFHSGSRLRAQENLHRDLHFQRRLLENADQLILKILAVEMLARDLHTLSQLLDSDLYLHEHLPDFADVLFDLSDQERSVDVCIRREFVAMANLMLTMRSARPFDTNTEIPEWLMSVLYKPNTTVNRMFERYEKTHGLATLSPPELAGALPRPGGNDKAQASKKVDYVLNPVGTILVEIASPELDRYLLILGDLTGLLRLVRLKRAIRSRGLTAHEVAGFLENQSPDSASPYDLNPMRWDHERQVIYFSGLSDRRHLHELTLYF